MKLDVANGDKGTLTDADGREVPCCISADTETGECVILARGVNGKYIIDTLESGVQVVRRQTTYFKPPLKWIPFDIHSITETAKNG